MTGGPSTNFHGVGIGPLSKILAVKCIILIDSDTHKNAADCFGSDMFFNATCFNASAISKSESFYPLFMFKTFFNYFRQCYWDFEALNFCFLQNMYLHSSFYNSTKLRKQYEWLTSISVEFLCEPILIRYCRLPCLMFQNL